MAIMNDGFSTKLTIAGVTLYEKEVTPPGVSGGGEIDITTMRNTAWRTRAPKSLKTLSPASLTVAYDPSDYDDIISAVNTNQSIVVTFPDSSTLTFYGWIDEFTPNANVEGDQPTAAITIIPSNVNAGSETAPVYAAAP